MTELATTAPVSRSARDAFRELHAKDYNFPLGRNAEYSPRTGWTIDDYRQPLPPEPPGLPLPDGSWAACRRHLDSYAFADPAIVRAAYRPDDPLEGRNMLLEGRFYGLRFRVGLRVGDVVDATTRVEGRRVRRWGWSYRTLEGHLEMGQMDYEVRKWLDSGEVDFRIHAFSRPAPIPNPVVALGFRLFGRAMQRRFARNALTRMDRLVRASVAARQPRGARPSPVRTPGRCSRAVPPRR